jgi:hypothetical protein
LRPDCCFAPRLLAAWRRVQASGVLQLRHIDGHVEFQNGVRSLDQSKAALAADIAARGLRPCALETCGAREVHPDQFSSCAACRAVAYCCKEHQAAHGPDHKAACKAARKGKAAAGDAAGSA